MSGSGSTTPTPNLPSHHTATPTPDPTTSRPHYTHFHQVEGPSHQHQPTSPAETREMRMHSPTSSSSPGDLADWEEHGTSQHSEQPTMGEPPKKKRTRMLLTPYQSSVLSSLFAQVGCFCFFQPVADPCRAVSLSYYSYAGGSRQVDWSKR